ncbi:Uncharacterized protein QJS10_CPA06g01878 [Acorus calamus]|uniref:DNA/RNA-binding protein Alba-like domain-containing protein n=1 Tax=Acorus calamus TaxID=4465 RepID=A0AAV9ENP4_ACOCL|nr:Uncharacterized protein QJS10_CPA06g01878 [Acorus calamus]
MEGVTVSEPPPPPPAMKGGADGAVKKTNRIQVSNTKKPLFFYVNLAKKYMQQHDEIELSALGMAISTVVTVSEILKKSGLATEKKILTSTVDMKDEKKGRLISKSKIEILLGKTQSSKEQTATNAEQQSGVTKDKAGTGEGKE